MSSAAINLGRPALPTTPLPRGAPDAAANRSRCRIFLGFIGCCRVASRGLQRGELEDSERMAREQRDQEPLPARVVAQIGGALEVIDDGLKRAIAVTPVHGA